MFNTIIETYNSHTGHAENHNDALKYLPILRNSFLLYRYLYIFYGNI